MNERAKIAALLNEAERYRQSGDISRADKRYRAALKRAPNDPQVNFLIGRFKARARETAHEAIKHLQTSIKYKPDFVGSHGQLGQLYLSVGDLQNAETSFRQVIELNKRDWSGFLNLANALMRQNRLGEASQIIADGLAVAPRNAELLNTQGLIQRQFERFDEAELSFRQAIKAKSASYQAHYNLIRLLEIRSKYDDLSEALAAARESCGTTPFIIMAEARQLRRDNQLSEARRLLESIADAPMDEREKARRSFLHGMICDGLDMPAQAFDSFVAANQVRARINPHHSALMAQYLERIRRYDDLIDGEWNTRWSAHDQSDEQSSPIFLIGFPRSGTTLVETMLRGHPDLIVAGEPPTLDRVRARLDEMGDDTLKRLPKFDGAEVAELRRVYFTTMEAVLDSDELKRAHRVVDKQPLNMINAALIYRMFPDARFIFVERHPCDSVLSCFMQDFVTSEEMSSFLNIQNAARLYDASMSLWIKLRDRLEFPAITVRYEDLIANAEAEMQKAAECTAIGWDPGLIAHRETAQRDDTVRTPSRTQVAEPLYDRAIYRWERYRTQLADVLPILLPWADRLGYKDSGAAST